MLECLKLNRIQEMCKERLDEGPQHRVRVEGPRPSECESHVPAGDAPGFLVFSRRRAAGRGRPLPLGAARVSTRRSVESAEGSGSHAEFKDREGNQEEEGMRRLEGGKGKIAQSCPTLCGPTDYTVHGIPQARILECVAFPFSRGSSHLRDQTQVSHIAGGFFTS